jgi:flavin reductase (DIM6/NTAB) family NADH-FMN oxidoreductase RutF
VIDRDVKKCLGQMTKGVQVVAARHDGITRAYTSHWVSQISFEEPVLLASISPKHDTHPLIEASGWFTVSILGGDQVEEGQYFSYPGRKFHHLFEEYLAETEIDGVGPVPHVVGCLAWLRCQVRQKLDLGLDHDCYVVDVVDVGEGRLKADPLVYSSRHGWRVAGQSARAKGDSVRDRLLERLDAAGIDSGSP